MNILKFKKKNIDDTKIDFVKIIFAVNKSWIVANNINDSTVSLNRYENGWRKLATNKISETMDEILYEAISQSLSIFAIVGKEKVCPICPAESEWSTCINNTQTRVIYYCNISTNYSCEVYYQTRICKLEEIIEKDKIFVLLLGILLVCILVVGYFLCKPRKRRKKEEVFIKKRRRSR